MTAAPNKTCLFCRRARNTRAHQLEMPSLATVQDKKHVEEHGEPETQCERACGILQELPDLKNITHNIPCHEEPTAWPANLECVPEHVRTSKCDPRVRRCGSGLFYGKSHPYNYGGQVKRSAKACSHRSRVQKLEKVWQTQK